MRDYAYQRNLRTRLGLAHITRCPCHGAWVYDGRCALPRLHHIPEDAT